MKRVMMAMIVATLFAGMITGCSIKNGSASEGKNTCCEQEEDGATPSCCDESETESEKSCCD
ncbi:hypothetical protein [Butyrivibrio sp. FC2001]|uniref:hypothetical protein n=1 Tax=Butyrivibrio sp. FC2001 TaxID=1280671 RepID=UPI0003F79A86|nr:hypothetical protein [Butyrivibrio sp. FC2001]